MLGDVIISIHAPNVDFHMTSTVGTEDDTFNTLRRTPIEDLDAEYRQRMWEFYSCTPVFTEWLDKHGWDKVSFFQAGKKYEKSLRSGLNNNV